LRRRRGPREALTLEDDAKGAFADFLANAVVSADDIGSGERLGGMGGRGSDDVGGGH